MCSSEEIHYKSACWIARNVPIARKRTIKPHLLAAPVSPPNQEKEGGQRDKPKGVSTGGDQASSRSWKWYILSEYCSLPDNSCLPVIHPAACLPLIHPAACLLAPACPDTQNVPPECPRKPPFSSLRNYKTNAARRQ